MIQPALSPRNFRLRDAGRSAICFILLAIAFAAAFYLLPLAQSLTLPRAQGGVAGPWVIRPIIAYRFCASGFLAIVSTPMLLSPLRRRWRAEDTEAGTYATNPLHGRPVAKAAFYFTGSIIPLIYGLGLVCYVMSYNIVDSTGIEKRLPWVCRKHTFDQITYLETVPAGMRVDGLVGNGPWCRIVFADNSSIAFSHENEGLAASDLSHIKDYISSRSGLTWRVRAGVRRF